MTLNTHIKCIPYNKCPAWEWNMVGLLGNRAEPGLSLRFFLAHPPPSIQIYEAKRDYLMRQPHTCKETLKH